ncbi:hypothetical protein AURANDRAFT_34490, partial [Aureococcus anophagefferens]
MACPRADADAAAGVDVPPGFKPRIFDVLTGAPGLEPLFEVPDMPLYMAAAAPGTAARDDSKAALRFWWSPATGSVQVHPLAPLEEVYARQHTASIGSLWPKHHAAFADFITRRRPRHVLEVGGGPGDLAKQLAGRAVERWTLVDPRATCPELEGLDIVRAFFDDVDEGALEPVDAVVHSHLFEHLYDPRAFLGRVARLLKPGGRMLFSARGRAPDARRAPSGRAHQVPNMTGALKTSTQPSLHWEHTWLVHEAYVRWLLADFGFEVRDTLAFGGAHSVFYDAEYVGPLPRGAGPPPCLGTQLADLVLAWKAGLDADAARFQRAAKAHGGDAFVFAAHVGSQYLLRTGLDEGLLRGVLDNNPARAGRRLAGFRLSTARPADVLTNATRPLVLLRQGVYDDEIEADL